MQVSHNDIATYASTFTSFKDTLQSLKSGKYNSGNIEQLNTTAGTITFSSWDDEVATKLKANKEELLTTILPTISNDFNVRFSKMCTLATNICSEYSKYKSYDQTYNSIKSNEEDEDKKETRRKAGINRESSLTKINGYLTELAAIDFNVAASTASNPQDTPTTTEEQTQEPKLSPGVEHILVAMQANKWYRIDKNNPSNTRTQYYETRFTDGTDVCVVIGDNGQVLWFRYTVPKNDGTGFVNTTFYDASLNEISGDQAVEISRQYDESQGVIWGEGTTTGVASNPLDGYTPIGGASTSYQIINGKFTKCQMYRAPDGRYVWIPI